MSKKKNIEHYIWVHCHWCDNVYLETDEWLEKDLNSICPSCGAELEPK